MKRSILVIYVLAFMVSVSFSSPIVVPDEVESLQEAVRISEEGDTILVMPGRYVENVRIEDKILTIGSMFLTTGDTAYIDSTVIDGGNNGHSVFSVRSCNREEGIVFEGITITNGVTDYGGGIYANDSRFDLHFCHITGDTADSGGGVYYTNGSEGVITNTSFTLNRAFLGGGGCAVVNGSNIEFHWCRFTDNRGQTGVGIFMNNESSVVIDSSYFCNPFGCEDGGNIKCFESEELRITNSTIARGDAGVGGGLFVQWTPIFYMDNVDVIDNFASDRGGGIYALGAGIDFTDVRIEGNHCSGTGGGMRTSTIQAFLKHCIIANNSCDEFGGGIHNDGNLDLNFCTIYGNTADDRSGSAICHSDCRTLIHNSILWGNGEYPIASFDAQLGIEFSDFEHGEDGILLLGEQDVFFQGDGNFDQDPLFADPVNSNFYLTAESPCIDAGNPALVFDPDGTLPDIGALYFHQCDIEMPFDAADFGELEAGLVDSVVLNISNVGGNQLMLTEFELLPEDGVFYAGDMPDTLTINAESTFSLTIYCQSVDLGNHRGGLTFQTNDPDEREVELRLTASIVPMREIAMMPGEIVFSQTPLMTSDSCNVTIQNTGGGLLTILSHYLTDNEPSLQIGECAEEFSLQGGESITIWLYY